MTINKNLTLNFEAVNEYPPIRFEIRIVAADSIRTEISDSQVSSIKHINSIQKNKMAAVTDQCNAHRTT